MSDENRASSGTNILTHLYRSLFCSKKACPPPQLQSQKTVVRDVDYVRERQREWFEAVKKSDVDHMQELLDEGVNINAVDENHWCALHLSAWSGLTSVCHALLLHPSIDVNQSGPSGSTALTLASQMGHMEIVQLLIQAKCNIHATAQLDNCHGVTALHLASKNGFSEITRMLIMAGSLVNATMTSNDVGGVTALHLAVEAGHTEVMNVLIEHGCDVHSATKPNIETAC